MPTLVEGMPTNERPTAYGFEHHADGRCYLFRRGPDYTCTESTLVNAARRWARSKGFVLEHGVQRRYPPKKGADPIIDGVVLRFVRTHANGNGNGARPIQPPASDGPSRIEPGDDAE